MRLSKALKVDKKYLNTKLESQVFTDKSTAYKVETEILTSTPNYRGKKNPACWSVEILSENS